MRPGPLRISSFDCARTGSAGSLPRGAITPAKRLRRRDLSTAIGTSPRGIKGQPRDLPLFLCYHSHVMGKYDSELATLHIWQKTSAKLFLNFAGAGATIRCLGTL